MVISPDHRRHPCPISATEPIITLINVFTVEPAGSSSIEFAQAIVAVLRQAHGIY
jgi:hypothetical protein